ncbi:hypothetical protein BDN72DRAFT_903600, partial [Pluteus cervinus]
MVAQKKTTKEEEAFLKERLDEYKKYQLTGRYKGFWITLFREWEEAFPEREKVFPELVGPLTEEQLAALGPSYKETHDKLQTWYRWRVKGVKDGTKTSETSAKVFKFLNKWYSAKTRALQPAEAYMNVYGDERVTPRVNEIIAGMDEKLGQGVRMQITNQVKRDQYQADKDDPEVAKKVAEEIARDSKLKGKMKEGELTDAERANNINLCPALLYEVISTAARNTGWSITVLMGGPHPDLDGKLDMRSIHVGETSTGSRFPATLATFETDILGPYYDFLRLVNPDEATLSDPKFQHEEAPGSWNDLLSLDDHDDGEEESKDANPQTEKKSATRKTKAENSEATNLQEAGSSAIKGRAKPKAKGVTAKPSIASAEESTPPVPATPGATASTPSTTAGEASTQAATSLPPIPTTFTEGSSQVATFSGHVHPIDPTLASFDAQTSWGSFNIPFIQGPQGLPLEPLWQELVPAGGDLVAWMQSPGIAPPGHSTFIDAENAGNFYPLRQASFSTPTSTASSPRTIDMDFEMDNRQSEAATLVSLGKNFLPFPMPVPLAAATAVTFGSMGGAPPPSNTTPPMLASTPVTASLPPPVSVILAANAPAPPSVQIPATSLPAPPISAIQQAPTTST